MWHWYHIKIEFIWCLNKRLDCLACTPRIIEAPQICWVVSLSLHGLFLVVGMSKHGNKTAICQKTFCTWLLLKKKHVMRCKFKFFQRSHKNCFHSIKNVIAWSKPAAKEEFNIKDNIRTVSKYFFTRLKIMMFLQIFRNA